MTSNGPSAVLSSDEIEALERDVIAEAKGGRMQAALQKVQPLRRAQFRQDDAAMALLRIVYDQVLERQAAIDILSEIAQSHEQDVRILSALGQCLEGVRDIDDLNAPPPEHRIFHTVVEKLDAFAKAHEGLPGRIAAPPDFAPARLLELIDKGIEKRGRCQLYAPDLCAAAGLMARERIDRRRFVLLRSN